MAIKISGTTVIDDSCNVTNANTFTATTFVGDGSGLTGVAAPPAAVLKPENTLPADGATGCLSGTVLCGGEYFSLYDKAHTCTCFQVSLCSDFSTCNVLTCELAGACRSLSINPSSDGLCSATTHFFRLRYEDEDGCCSEFSDATCFDTGTFLNPGALGSSFCGGFYMGVTGPHDGKCYYLIMAPNSGGCVFGCQFKVTRGVTPSCEDTRFCGDGYRNTYEVFASGSRFPAGNWTATRTLNGFSDWFLGSTGENFQLRNNQACSPPGEGFASGTAEYYWAGEANFSPRAFIWSVASGTTCTYKDRGNFARTRAMRRELI